MGKFLNPLLGIAIACVLVVICERDTTRNLPEPVKVNPTVNTAPAPAKVNTVAEAKPTFDPILKETYCQTGCPCKFCGQDNTPAKPVASQSGCANGRCQLPATNPKKTTVAAPRVTGSCSGGSCSSRGVFRGRGLFGRR